MPSWIPVCTGFTWKMISENTGLIFRQNIRFQECLVFFRLNKESTEKNARESQFGRNVLLRKLVVVLARIRQWGCMYGWRELLYMKWFVSIVHSMESASAQVEKEARSRVDIYGYSYWLMASPLTKSLLRRCLSLCPRKCPSAAQCVEAATDMLDAFDSTWPDLPNIIAL